MQHYLRTSRWVVADATGLAVGTNCTVRRWVGAEAASLLEEVRKRNVFSRHAGAGDFYFQRAEALHGATVIDISSSRWTSTDLLAKEAQIAENVVATSFILSGSRREFVRCVVGVPQPYLDLNLVRRGSDLDVSSTSVAAKAPSGLKLDGRIASRYKRNGFPALYDFAVTECDLASRIRASLIWLMESRTEAVVYSALVKTATALESLLVIGKEPATRALAERGAYLLSAGPEEREKLSRATLRFYDIRGEIVHGKRSAEPLAVERALEYGDRITVLLALVLSAQGAAWKSVNDVQAYCDRARWGYPAACKRPWGRVQVRRALDRLA